MKLELKQILAGALISGFCTSNLSASENLDDLNSELEALKAKVDQLQQEITQSRAVTVPQSPALAIPESLVHLSGYADVGYVDSNTGDGGFKMGRFAPIFHYQFRDLVLLESELEIEIAEDGSAETTLEYLSIDVFLNDYITLVAGKFLSPIGQFRQNLHPSWINKLASAPTGFGHDGAAPVSEVGVQLRGGFHLGETRTNYALYVANGPSLLAGFDDGEFELDGIMAEGSNSDSDGEKVFGGRFGVFPIPGLEVGISLATGKAAVKAIEDGDSSMLSGEGARDYDVTGADFAYQRNNFYLRGEYVKSEIGATNLGLAASDGGVWKTWYTQASYVPSQSKLEYVTRYTDFDSPHAIKDQKQWALGINYLYTSSAVFKLNYELNDGLAGAVTDENRVIFQLTYGF